LLWCGFGHIVQGRIVISKLQPTLLLSFFSDYQQIPLPSGLFEDGFSSSVDRFGAFIERKNMWAFRILF
jgi:hypothetical protein